MPNVTVEIPYLLREMGRILKEINEGVVVDADQPRAPEELMKPRRPKAMLIGETPQGSSYLAKPLQERGCVCEFAVSFQEACSLLSAQGFDLVLSPTRLRNGSLFPPD